MGLQLLLCALVLAQLFSLDQCIQGVHDIVGDPNLELPSSASRDLSDAAVNVLRSYMVRKDSLGAKSASERFLKAVQQSHSRIRRKVRPTAARDDGVTREEAIQVPVSFGEAVFVMPVKLGTPPQQFTVEVDTGSQLCWLQCAPCKRCFHQPHAFFNPAASSSYSEAFCHDPLCLESLDRTCTITNKCSYNYAYDDASSTTGVLAYETLTMSGSTASHFAFGCGDDNQGNFEAEDGLFGLSQSALALPSQLDQTMGVAKVFSYCLLPQFDGARRVASSVLTFGDTAEHANAAYSTLVPNPYEHYYLDVVGISVGGHLLDIPKSVFELRDGDGGVLLDSGTTLTYWIRPAFDSIVKAFREQIAFREVDAHPYELYLCYDVGAGTNAPSFPVMVVHMAEDVNLEIPAVSMFVSVTDDASVVCLSMVPADDESTIGNISQENNLVVYDLVNQRIGFQKTQC